jgi:hypothetical protein
MGSAPFLSLIIIVLKITTNWTLINHILKLFENGLM